MCASLLRLQDCQKRLSREKTDCPPVPAQCLLSRGLILIALLQIVASDSPQSASPRFSQDGTPSRSLQPLPDVFSDLPGTTGKQTRTRDLLEDEASEHPIRPEESWIAPLTRPDQEYRVFHNVLLRTANHMLFFPPSNSSAAATRQALPDMSQLLQWQYWNLDDMEPFNITAVQESDSSDTCLRWIDRPTLYYSGINVIHLNAAHFLHNMISMVYTSLQTGCFSLDRMRSWKGLPSSDDANFMVIQRQPRVLASPLNWLLDFITPDVTIASRMAGSCFRTLIVGVDESANVYGVPSGSRVQRRRDAFAAFQEYALEAITRMHALRNWPAVNLVQRGEGGKMRIGWVSRPKQEWSSRAALNEAEVVAGIQERYHADVSILKFKSGQGELAKAVVAVHQLDILIGMHGAGLVNMLWMQPGAVVLQMLPYGWHAANESHFPNAVMFEQTAHGLGLYHLLWSNTDPQKAYFIPTDFANRSDWVEHPGPTTPLPLDKWKDHSAERWWHFQDTEIDTDSFFSMLDEAVKLVGGSHRA